MRLDVNGGNRWFEPDPALTFFTGRKGFSVEHCHIVFRSVLLSMNDFEKSGARHWAPGLQEICHEEFLEHYVAGRDASHDLLFTTIMAVFDVGVIARQQPDMHNSN